MAVPVTSSLKTMTEKAINTLSKLVTKISNSFEVIILVAVILFILLGA